MMTASTGSEGCLEESGVAQQARPGLADQLERVEQLLVRLLAAHSRQEVEQGAELRTRLAEQDQAIQEMRAKAAKNRQILTNNWEQAEGEVIERLKFVYMLCYSVNIK